MLKCNTRDFGEIQVDENEVIKFIQPLYGFEEYRKFVILHDKEIGNQIAWLQSCEDPSVCFILFDPNPLAPFFAPILSGDTESMLGEGELLCWVVGVVPDDFNKTTVNLRSPIIVNADTKCAAQIILEQDYPVRHLLMKEAE